MSAASSASVPEVVERNADRMTDSKVSLPSELFSGNPQLPADENNHFIPVSLQRPTTIFAYSMLTRCYTTEFESMKKLVKEGGIEGCCLKEKELLDPNDNMVKVVLEVEENGLPCKVCCKIFFATQFAAIREARDAFSYLLSLSICQPQDTHGGKSGAVFYITGDSRYLVKEISSREFEMFVTNAHSYFQYMAKCLFHGLTSLLCKVFGIYQTTVIDSSNRKTVSHYVMENLFYNQKIVDKFDLKGSSRNRYANEGCGSEENTLLDVNFMERRKGIPLPLHESSKKLLNIGILNDTLFLYLIKVVDYSLLVGINEETHELVVGIIDYFRCYDVLKKIENGVKSVGMIIGEKAPTIVPPEDYKKRFRISMDSYFVTMPDQYFQLKH
ncbi:uncharacterized protein [Blastocystis hominis]|uniref:PIPK domain-containing protein n=1 Tax=Blastocystis hominis TaxID=12968 RepID=D8M0J1_BLAHO|nr:uncharacterized protein [Blastocystis hominis]CBK21580.2 unnamed protein product [Blastocystis hominis]|eukprot:XP_012895628.1 uncharacterized protein [Blastocystis hominis]